MRATLEPLVEMGSAGRTGISDLEIGFSARNAEEWDALSRALGSLTLIDTTEEHLTRARYIQRRLAEQGLRGHKIPDLLVAAAAEEHGLVILHYDVDFDRISAVTGQPAEWIVPRGTVD